MTRSMDHKGSIVAPKSAAGVRDVPIAKVLHSLLAAHRLANVGDGYVFGSSLSTPFTPSAVMRRAGCGGVRSKRSSRSPISGYTRRGTRSPRS